MLKIHQFFNLFWVFSCSFYILKSLLCVIIIIYIDDKGRASVTLIEALTFEDLRSKTLFSGSETI